MQALTVIVQRRDGAGQKIGLEIWRVENRRTDDDRPDFGVKRWPSSEYGKFYKGDSYIIMNTFLASPDAAKFSFGEFRSSAQRPDRAMRCAVH